MTRYAIQAAQLAVVCREIDDTELHRACDRLRDVAIEADEVDARFHAAADQLKALLTARIG